MYQMELPLFPIESYDFMHLHKELSDTKEELGKVRRGIFHRHSALDRELKTLREELELLKSSKKQGSYETTIAET
jgi:hypothetical protein